MSRVDVSVVLPCLNEEAGLAECLRKIREVFGREKIDGEIVVCDNGSTDGSKDIAREAGAVLVEEPQRGYGAAYLRGLSAARGRFIVIGDSDNSYDFLEIPRFLQPLREGYDFVIGSRFTGTIRGGAMPWANRYIGNPILSGMTRLFFRVGLSDIHCGMRSFTREAYEKMRLHSPGMEFATEMVVSSLNNRLKVKEIAIDYYPRTGVSKLDPVTDAWRHIRFMLLYSPLWLYMLPGAAGLAAGFSILLLLLPGPIHFLGRTWDIHPMVFASAITILSYQLIMLGLFAHIFAIHEGFVRSGRFFAFIRRYFHLEKALFAGALLFLAGLAINMMIIAEWFRNHWGALYRLRESILAMTFLVIGLQTVFSSFFISLLFMRREPADS